MNIEHLIDQAKGTTSDLDSSRAAATGYPVAVIETSMEMAARSRCDDLTGGCSCARPE